jgi:hypothetical protein
MKKNKPLIIGAAVIGLGFLAYYLYKRGTKTTDANQETETTEPPTLIGKIKPGANPILKIGMKRPGAN